MQHAGMVHALEETYRLLAPAGCLIDIHPALSPTLIEVHRCRTILFSTQLPDESFEDIQCAEDALAQVIKEGLFVVERRDQFDWRTYASSVAELLDYIIEESGYQEEPSAELDALRKSDLPDRVQEVLQVAGEGAEVARLYPACIARLKPVRR